MQLGVRFFIELWGGSICYIEICLTLSLFPIPWIREFLRDDELWVREALDGSIRSSFGLGSS